MLTPWRADDGQITLLVIGYVAIAAVLLVVGVDVSTVFLARRSLSSAADAAALAGAQGVDRAALYAGSDLRCGSRLPLDRSRASELAGLSIDDSRSALAHHFKSLDPPQTSVSADTVDVQLSGEVGVPFGHVIGWLDPSRPDGRVHVVVTSHARSPVNGGGDC